MIQLKKYRGLFVGLLALLSVSLITWMKTHSQKMKKNNLAYDLYRSLLLKGFYPDTAKYIISQSVHETGNFTSRIFKENNNLFGMKLPEVRATLAIGSNYGHAVFANLEDSLNDYAMYWNARKMPAIFSTISDFVSLLKKKGYFEDKEENYLRGVINAYNTYFIDE